jgi:hypothetical protein
MPITKASSNAVAPAAKGDLVVGNATNDSGVLAVGANGTTLIADSAEATGLKWATASAGGMTLLSTTSLTGASVTISSIDQSYKNLLIIVKNGYLASASGDTFIRLNGDTGNNYTFGAMSTGTGGFASYPNTKISLIDHTTNSVTLLKQIRAAINIYRYTDTDAIFGTVSSIAYYDGTSVIQGQHIPFTYDCSAAITSITFFGDFNWSGGTVYIYGVN